MDVVVWAGALVLWSSARPNTAVATRYAWASRYKKKRTAAPSVLVWSPTTILGKALGCLNRTDRTGSLVFTRVWPQLEG